MSNAAAEKITPTNVVPMENHPLTAMDIVNRAIESGNIEVIGKAMDYQERWERNQARKAFDEAMAAAKAELPVILKNREVDFTSPKGRTNYRHEDLAGIARQIDPVLAKNGLSYRFRTSSVPNEPVMVTCIVSHRQGHSEENSLSGGRDDTGNKNGLQAIGSTVTYLQRYTLKAALGLAASNDDDGKAVEASATISEAQVVELRDLIEEVGADVQRTCAIFKIDGLALLPTKRFEEAKTRLKKFGNQQKGGAK